MPIQNLVDLDDISLDEITEWLELARAIEIGRRDVSNSISGRILCPLFGQESSRTFINSVTSFQRMGGTVLPMFLSGTRFGSKWKEPIQDFAVLLNSCCDQVVYRGSETQTVRELASLISVPFINAGNGVGKGAEHPMQALIDLYTIREEFQDRKLDILMIGGSHIRTTRTQIKLFLKDGHSVSIMSPPPPVDNSDIESLILQECGIVTASDPEHWQKFDLIYHNGIDENPDARSPKEYQLNLSMLSDRKFTGKIMHSLPRKNELSGDIDATPYNLYFRQMEVSQWVFQSIYYHQHIERRMSDHAA